MTVGIPQMKTFVFVKNLCDLTDENLIFSKIAKQRQKHVARNPATNWYGLKEPEFATKVW